MCLKHFSFRCQMDEKTIVYAKFYKLFIPFSELGMGCRFQPRSNTDCRFNTKESKGSKKTSGVRCSCVEMQEKGRCYGWHLSYMSLLPPFAFNSGSSPYEHPEIGTKEMVFFFFGSCSLWCIRVDNEMLIDCQ